MRRVVGDHEVAVVGPENPFDEDEPVGVDVLRFVNEDTVVGGDTGESLLRPVSCLQRFVDQALDLFGWIVVALLRSDE